MKTATAPKPKTSSRSSTSGSHRRRHKEPEAPSGSGRPLWAGSISFGLVNIPVRLYPAVREQRDRVSHAARPGQSPAPPADGLARKAVRKFIRNTSFAATNTRRINTSWFAMKSWKGAPGKDEDHRDHRLRRDRPRSIRSISIGPYYVMPQAGSSKPYRLLVEAMQRLQARGPCPARHAREGTPRRPAASGWAAVHRNDALRG